MGGHSLPFLDLPQCLLEGPQVFAISGHCPLVVVDGSPPVGFVVVLYFSMSRFSVRRPPVKSAATPLGYAGLPVVMRTLFLGHSVL